MINALEASSPIERVFENIWDTLSSRTAIIFYVVIIAICVIILIYQILKGEQKREEILTYRDKNLKDIEKENFAEGFAKKEMNDNPFGTSNSSIASTIISSDSSISINKASSRGDLGSTHSSDGDGNEDDIINSEDGSSRFYMLSQIDQKMEFKTPVKYDKSMNLKEICDDFRNFACNRLKLYYDIEDIRRFIGGLSDNR